MSQPTTRIRRGKVITIPEEWRGKVTYPQTKNKRQSRLTRKDKNATKAKWRKHGYFNPRERDEARAPTVQEFDS